MIEIQNPGGWPGLRIILAAAVSFGRSVNIAGGADIIKSDEYLQPLFEETARISEEFLCTRIELSGANIRVDNLSEHNPASRFGRALINCRKDVPVSEIMLFMAPSLFNAGFRSAIDLTGTTHAGRFNPLSYTRDTLFDALAGFGFYSGVNLETFGFKGTASGKLEWRIYPAESVPSDNWQIFDFRRLSRARVYFSEIPQQAATAQKQYLAQICGIDSSSVSILDIMNAPGRHNSVYVHVATERYDIVFFREIDSFDRIEDPQNAAADSLSLLDEVVVEAKKFVNSGRIPLFLERELIPYALISGSKPEPVYTENRRLFENLSNILFATK